MKEFNTVVSLSPPGNSAGDKELRNRFVTTAAKDLAGNTLAATVTRSFRVIRQKTVSLESQAALDGFVYL